MKIFKLIDSQNEIRLEVEKLKLVVENLIAETKLVNKKYEDFLFEKDEYNRQLREVIGKKVDYLRKKEESLDIKGEMKRRLGIGRI